MIVLDSFQRTKELGRHLAEILPACRPMPALLLDGDLGAGKTTLTRELVLCLPYHMYRLLYILPVLEKVQQ